MEVRPFDNPENNFIMLHNTIFDEVMKKCTPSEWKVLSAILRKTRGWQRDTDHISYSQIRDITGLSSNATIKDAIDGLSNKKMILIKRGNVNTPNRFTLNRNYIAITDSVIPPVTENVIPPITDSVNTKDNTLNTSINGLSDPEILIDAFERIAKITRPIDMVEPYEYMKWEREIAKWEKINVTADDIRNAVAEADKADLTLAWPGSITNIMKSAIAKKERGVITNQRKGKKNESVEETLERLRKEEMQISEVIDG